MLFFVEIRIRPNKQFRSLIEYIKNREGGSKIPPYFLDLALHNPLNIRLTAEGSNTYSIKWGTLVLGVVITTPLRQ